MKTFAIGLVAALLSTAAYAQTSNSNSSMSNSNGGQASSRASGQAQMDTKADKGGKASMRSSQKLDSDDKAVAGERRGGERMSSESREHGSRTSVRVRTSMSEGGGLRVRHRHHSVTVASDDEPRTRVIHRHKKVVYIHGRPSKRYVRIHREEEPSVSIRRRTTVRTEGGGMRTGSMEHSRTTVRSGSTEMRGTASSRDRSSHETTGTIRSRSEGSMDKGGSDRGSKGDSMKDGAMKSGGRSGSDKDMH